MESNPPEDAQEGPILKLTPTNGLTTYFCPFCGHKLFRGKVNSFSMVCDNCNKLVRDTDLNKETEPEES